MIQRLSDKTREMAYEALLGKWGKQLIPTPIVLTEQEEQQYPDVGDMVYALGVKHIAQEAPIRITPDELLVGATTLKEGPWHQLPVRRRNGNILTDSISHVTLGFDEVLKIGYRGLRSHVENRLSRRGDLDEKQVEFLQACLVTLDAMQIWHTRYMRLLDERISQSEGEQKTHYEQIRENLKDVPENPPKNFREAIQSLWFMFAWQRQCGNWPGIGRIDVMLGDFLKQDLADGTITLDEAREYVAHFWIKGCEWIGESGLFDGSGDGQHYQNIILSGVDEDGKDIENEMTFLVLDVVEETLISDFPVSVRISKRTSEKLFRRIAEVQRLGTGTIAVYNNDFVIDSLVKFGYDLKEARNFANDGCWEIQIPGKTCFSYHPLDTVMMLDEALGLHSDEIPDYQSFEEVYAAYDAIVQKTIQTLMDGADQYGRTGRYNTCVSLFTEGCIENARGYFQRGAKYYVLSPHMASVGSVADSLYCIKKFVFDEKLLTFQKLVTCLKNNWEGEEPLRQWILNHFEGFGNANPEADAMARRVLHDFARFQTGVKVRDGVLRPAGVSTFGREISWRGQRMAQADGHKAHDILSANITPAVGQDKMGPTAILTSVGSLGLDCIANGTALDLKICPGSIEGEDGLQAMIGLYKTFIDKGCIFTHINVVDDKVLRDAVIHPDLYQTLAVRVSGWCARFVTLSPEWQEMIIKRNMQTKA